MKSTLVIDRAELAAVISELLGHGIAFKAEQSEDKVVIQFY